MFCPSYRICVCVFLIGCVMPFAAQGERCFAAEKEKIDAAIKKAHGFLLKQTLSGPNGSLAALAYVKSGGDRNALCVQDMVREASQKIQNGSYFPRLHHIYEATVDLMLFEAIDAKNFRPQMEAAAAYVMRMQLSNGAWYYPNSMEPNCGDTSITQYALIGLWAASRVGIEIPSEVWENAAKWQISTKKDDGGFAYHPFDKKSQSIPEHFTTCCTMTAAGTSSLLIARRMLFGDVVFDPGIKLTSSKRRFGVLEKFTDDKPMSKLELKSQLPQIDNTLRESLRWMFLHFSENSKAHESWFTYDLYCIERVTALLDLELIGNHDWYNEGSDELLAKQLSDGSWKDTCTTVASTALGLMFLAKVTAAVINPKPKINLLGGGLQAGGRGLPENLDAIQVKDGNVTARKMVGSVDNLLIELERSSGARVEDVQAAIVDSVQLDRPEELIGQMVRLRKLAEDPRLEVRRTAIWALGRSGDVSGTPALIRALSDQDLSIAREASLALCILSRLPEGIGLPIDPANDSQMKLTEISTDDQRKSTLDEWRKESKQKWIEWYQKNRPYDERDDHTTLKRNNK